MAERIIAVVDVSYKDGSLKEVVTEAKPIDEIFECEKGRIVVLMLSNGTNLTGIFAGANGDDDESFLLATVDDHNRIFAFSKHGAEDFYFEEIDEMPEGEAEILEDFT